MTIIFRKYANHLFALAIFSFFYSEVIAQKPLLTYEAYKDWDGDIKSPVLSSNGGFFSYQRKDSLYLVSADGRQRQAFYVNSKETKKQQFSANDEWFFFQSKDSLCIVKPGSGMVRYITNVTGFDLSRSKNWLAYIAKSVDRQEAKLGLLKLSGELETTVEYNILKSTSRDPLFHPDFKFSESGTSIAWIEPVDNKTNKVRWMNLNDQKVYEVCTAGQNVQLVFNKKGDRLVVVSTSALSPDNAGYLTVQFFTRGMENAGTIDMAGNDLLKDYTVYQGSLPFFSKDDHHLYLFLMKKNAPDSSVAGLSPSSVQIFGNGGPAYNHLVGISFFPRILAVVDLDSAPVTPVVLFQKDKGDTEIPMETDMENGQYTVVSGDVITNQEYLYKRDTTYRPNIYLVSCLNGERRLLVRRAVILNLSFSPTGKYISWYDKIKKQWMIHIIAQNRTIAVTKRIAEPFFDVNLDKPVFSQPQPGNLKWLPDDEAVLIPALYNIWQVDPEDKKTPINITRGYGKGHHIRFRCMEGGNNSRQSRNKNDAVLLSAFDTDTREAGYFKLDIQTYKLQQLILSPHKYSDLFKAETADVYFFKRESSTDYPNYYVTNDFKNITKLTHVNPERNYNWYKTELVKWKLPNGKMDEGILYKPGDFDPKKKYPLIFYYYERNVYGLNTYVKPALSSAGLAVCIPWYTSNGYLVFIPDIYYRIGHPGQSACDAVVSAAKHLSQFSWVDSRHMGLQGHSFGGFETNYIVSHSNLFAAAAPGSGVSNAIESYGDTYGWYYYEAGQGRIKESLWQRPDLYEENSAIFRADKVTTPLLILHGKKDGIIPYNHGWQWYQDLQRLNKKVWLLSYDAGHSLSGPDPLDYTVRMQQFFDYYLKGLPPPVWMTHPLISPDMIKSGEDLNLDTSGVEP